MLDPITISAWIGALVAAGGVIVGSAKFLFWVYDEWQKRRKHEGFSAPSETLRLATKMEGYCWWHMGKKSDEPTMQIVGTMFATNIASVPVRIPQVELRYGCCLRSRCRAVVTPILSGLHHEYRLAREAA
jgi:hypothetical protein